VIVFTQNGRHWKREKDRERERGKDEEGVEGVGGWEVGVKNEEKKREGAYEVARMGICA
jgi:hypothetical protein